jgi:hypothetical protein
MSGGDHRPNRGKTGFFLIEVHPDQTNAQGCENEKPGRMLVFRALLSLSGALLVAPFLPVRRNHEGVGCVTSVYCHVLPSTAVAYAIDSDLREQVVGRC